MVLPRQPTFVCLLPAVGGHRCSIPSDVMENWTESQELFLNHLPHCHAFSTLIPNTSTKCNNFEISENIIFFEKKSQYLKCHYLFVLPNKLMWIKTTHSTDFRINGKRLRKLLVNIL